MAQLGVMVQWVCALYHVVNIKYVQGFFNTNYTSIKWLKKKGSGSNLPPLVLCLSDSSLAPRKKPSESWNPHMPSSSTSLLTLLQG